MLNKILDSYKNININKENILQSKDFFHLLIKNRFNENKKTIFLVYPNLYEAQKAYDIFSEILPENKVLFFPQDELLTTLMALGSPEFANERLYTIRSLIFEKNNFLVITTPEGILKKELTKNDYINSIKKFKINDTYKLEKMIELLESNGYKRTYIVENIKEYSVRGSIIDFYSPFNINPYRIDFFDDIIETIKEFDIQTQRSIQNINEVDIFPLNELFYNNQILNNGLEKINLFFKDYKLSNKEKEKYEKDITNLKERSKLDSLSLYINFFSDKETYITDYVDNYEIITIDLDKIKINYESKKLDKKSYVESMDGDIFLKIKREKDFNIFLDEINYIFNQTGNYQNITNIFDVNFYDKNITLFLKEIKGYIEKEYKIYIILYSDKYLEILKDEFKINNILENKLNIIVSENNNYYNFIDYKNKVLIIDENHLFSSKNRVRIKYRSVINQSSKIRNISDLEENDYVVHYDYGIGIYRGLKTTSVSGQKRDYLYIEYLNDEFLYVPVDKIDLVLKYASNDSRKPSISKLGGKTWNSTKTKALIKIKDLSDRLLKLYAERKSKKGIFFVGNKELEESFAKDFEYKETIDQEKAINDCLNDMSSENPMDRLIIGDVGFGKTEIALRAAFKAVVSGFQVAFIAPTTILARQHYLNFKKRFSKYAGNVELLTRHISTKKQTEIKNNLKKGIVDIVIGTHRLLSKDIIFNNLGLLIMDEEQRFGVVAKEQIKETKTNIDTISLSATPIPRTLQMSLSGLKDLSIINTPPMNRYPIQTYVSKMDYGVIKEVIRRELARGGQVFYLFNNVELIESKVFKLQELIPEARITYAHGQMTKNLIEDKISSFIDHEYDILVATTIIETGIDIPNTNTLIIENSDKFGLSQLYQIRGRVGRSDKIAYAYLLYDERKILTPEAIKRLNAIENFTELGSGYKIALQDLNIRGSGDILGKEQAGFIDSVGIDLYLKLLDQEIKGIKLPENKKEEKIYASQHIDENYISSDKVRIEIHKSINNIINLEQLEDLKQELKDRFGNFDNEITLYMYDKVFKKLCNEIGITKVYNDKNTLRLSVTGNKINDLDGKKLFKVSNSFDLPVKLSNVNGEVVVEIDLRKDPRNFLIIGSKFIDKYLYKI